jgi:hypothetical protein
MTDQEILDAIDSAMRKVAERFRAKREAEAQQAAPKPDEQARSAA